VLKKSDAVVLQQYSKSRDPLGVSSLLLCAPSRIILSSDLRRRTFSTDPPKAAVRILVAKRRRLPL
jgi:hypothetical protein